MANLAKHGVAFEEVLAFRWDTALAIQDLRTDYGETRGIAFGFIRERLHTLIFTTRDPACRVISLRKANLRERRAYEEKKGQT